MMTPPSSGWIVSHGSAKYSHICQRPFTQSNSTPTVPPFGHERTPPHVPLPSQKPPSLIVDGGGHDGTGGGAGQAVWIHENRPLEHVHPPGGCGDGHFGASTSWQKSPSLEQEAPCRAFAHGFGQPACFGQLQAPFEHVQVTSYEPLQSVTCCVHAAFVEHAPVRFVGQSAGASTRPPQ